MQWRKRTVVARVAVVALLSAMTVQAQQAPAVAGITIAVVDENGGAVAGAEVTVEQPGSASQRLATDYNGRLHFDLQGTAPYRLRVQKPGYYQSEQNSLDPQQQDVRVVLAHQQMLVEQVNVSASAPGIDPQQVSDTITLALPEII